MPRNIWPDLATAQAHKIAELTQACDAAITGGYHSSALGSDHIYPNTTTDQINMLGSFVDAQNQNQSKQWKTPFTCVVPANVNDADWPMVDHTAAQIEQAAQDGKAWTITQRQKLATLKTQVRAATTVPEVLKIVWT